MIQRANVLNFNEAAELLGYKRKQQEPQTLKLARCHDGVWRVLADAAKFDMGRFAGTWMDFAAKNFKHGFPG